MNKAIKLSVLSVLFLQVGCEKVIEKYGYKFSSLIPEHQVNMIAKDLESIKELDLKNMDSRITEIFKVYPYESKLDRVKKYADWLDDRVTYITPEYSSGIASKLRFMNTYESYPNVGKLPIIEKDQVEASKGVTVMSNSGTLAYYIGKKESRRVGFKIGDSMVPVTSPRMGIITIGEGLFMTRLQINPLRPSLANSLGRLATYFHEARHSDGNGKTLGFFHAKCDEGYFKGKHACDRNTNGPYTIGALINKQASKSCSDCTASEKAKLLTASLDSFSRLNKYERQSLLDQMLRLEDKKIPVGKWDDNPEMLADHNINGFRSILKVQHKKVD